TNSGTSLATRSLLKVEKGARVSLVESFVAAEGAKAYQTHDSIVIWIGDGTELQHVRLMEDALDAANISTGIVTIGAKAKLNT
ncbi:SufD family Fe-S cluster assembly protein, partial [Serratia marcescens]|uniref:SufD family Fe-S cluster assembly protein n=1 Tax=Serratia marcescens TaxID=615 RepID=UPI002812B2C1